MAFEASFRTTVVQIAVRRALPVGIAAWTLWSGAPADRQQQIGTHAEVFLDDSAKAFLKTEARITVADSGLEEGRGLAFDQKGHRLYVADAWDGVYTCK